MEKYHGNTVEYWKQNAEEDYAKTPISVLKYITVLEEQAVTLNEIIEIIKEKLAYKELKLNLFNASAQAFAELQNRIQKDIDNTPPDLRLQNRIQKDIDNTPPDLRGNYSDDFPVGSVF